MRPPSVYAKGSCSAGDPCDVLGLLHGPHRIGCRLVMILLSHHGWSAATIAELLGCDPRTVRRWVHRYNTHGAHSLADRPRPGRPRLGSPRLGDRIRRLLAQPRAWTSRCCTGTWATPPSASTPCTDASARSRPGGDPGWSPRATPTATRSWPPCTSSSGTCPRARLS
jgi:Winged helix-turn helix